MSPRVTQTPDKEKIISPPARRTRSARKKRGIQLSDNESSVGSGPAAGADSETGVPTSPAVITPKPKAKSKVKSTPRSKTKSTPSKAEVSASAQKRVSLPPLPRSARPPRKPKAQDEIKTPSRRSMRKRALQQPYDLDMDSIMTVEEEGEDDEKTVKGKGKTKKETSTSTPLRRSSRRNRKVEDEETADEKEEEEHPESSDEKEKNDEQNQSSQSESNPTPQTETPKQKQKATPPRSTRISRKRKPAPHVETIVEEEETNGQKNKEEDSDEEMEVEVKGPNDDQDEESTEDQSPSPPKKLKQGPKLITPNIASPSVKSMTRTATPQMKVQVHRFRCINYIPKAILRLCATPFSPNEFHMPHLAVSREGGSVELVSPNEKWKCVSIIEGMKHRPIDAMAWVTIHNKDNKDGDDGDSNINEKGYFCTQHSQAAKCMSQRILIGASRDGTMMELDFSTKTQKGVMGSGGGAVFCLVSLSSEQLGGGYVAAGCEDGSVRIYRATADLRDIDDRDDIDNAPCLELVSTLPSVGAAVLSIAWLPSADGSMNGSIIYAGVADGTIRKFECSSSCSSSRSDPIGAKNSPHAMSTGYVFDQSTSTSLQWKASLRMTVENRGRRTATKIWALKALDDGTVISGDSMGNIQFWDGKYGTLLQSMEHNPHNADILDVAVSWDQKKVMASGIDSKVVCIERIPCPKQEGRKGGERYKPSQWVMTHQQRSHTHDVCSLAMVYTTDHVHGSFGSVTSSLSRSKKLFAVGSTNADAAPNAPFSSNHKELLCSGGVDTKVCSYFVANMKKYRAQIAYKYPTSAPIALSRVPRFLSIMRNDKIDFYHLSQNSNAIGAQDEERAYLGSVGIESSHNLISFDVSQDGKYLATSNAAGLLLFQLDLVDTFDENGDANRIIVPREIKLPASASVASAPCSSIIFGKDGLLVCATTQGPIHLMKLGTEDEDRDVDDDSEKSLVAVKLCHTFTHDLKSTSSSKTFPVSQLTISPDGHWLAAGRNTFGKGSIEVFSIGNTKKQHWWTLPCTEVPHSCIKFIGDDNVDPALAVGCNNGVVYLFDVEQRSLSDWSQDLGFPAAPNLPDELHLCSDCPDTLAYNKAEPNKFIMVSVCKRMVIGYEYETNLDVKCKTCYCCISAPTECMLVILAKVRYFLFSFALVAFHTSVIYMEDTKCIFLKNSLLYLYACDYQLTATIPNPSPWSRVGIHGSHQLI